MVCAVTWHVKAGGTFPPHCTSCSRTGDVLETRRVEVLVSGGYFVIIASGCDLVLAPTTESGKRASKVDVQHRQPFPFTSSTRPHQITSAGRLGATRAHGLSETPPRRGPLTHIYLLVSPAETGSIALACRPALHGILSSPLQPIPNLDPVHPTTTTTDDAWNVAYAREPAGELQPGQEAAACEPLGGGEP